MNRIKELVNKFVSSLFQNGIIATTKKVSLFFKNKIAQKKLKKYSFDCFYQAKYLPSKTENSDILPLCFYNISNMDISNLATKIPLFTNHYMPRLPLLFTENFVERINYHMKLAKEYKIYGFCYEINDINKFSTFFSNLYLLDVSMPYCISLHHKLTFENIQTIFKAIKYNDYIKNNDNYIIILDCTEKPNEIDEFVQKVDNALINFNINYELWLKAPYDTQVCNEKIKAVINTYNLSKIEKVSSNPYSHISINTQNKLYYYFKIANSLQKHKKSNKLEYNLITNAYDTLSENGIAFYKYSLNHLYNWIKNECTYLRKTYEKSKCFLFIDSFNNWEKLNHIVPEKHTGYAFLNTMYRAIFNKKIYGKKLSIYNQDLQEKFYTSPQICIHIHIFYIDILDEIIQEIKKIPYQFDVYISTDSYKKADIIMDIFQKHKKDCNVFIDVFENKGRDIAPFIMQMKHHITKYKFICHIHSKKTIVDSYGNDWREYLFNSLFGTEENITHIIKNLEYNKGLGIVFPKSFQVLEEAVHWSLNKDVGDKVLKKMKIAIMLPTNNIVFPVGNMFWARVDAILPFFINIKMDDFPKEKGQIDGTLAHAIERLWVYIAEYNGYTFSYCGK